MDPALENGCLSPVTPDQRTNGQHAQTNGADLAYQKASFQLDLDGGKCKPATDRDFLERPPADGKEDTYDEDDFGPETDVDTVDVGGDVDDVLMSPMIAAAEAAAAAAVAGVSPKEQHLAAIEADLELQRQQLSVFDPVSEPREETPTPPADDVTGGAALEPEADNVAESGDESEDEWNYYRVDPSEKKPAEAADPPPPTQPPPPPTDQEEDDESMESRLNPNAAEFVPSPTSLMPSMEEVLSASPFRGKLAPMDDVFVPTASEFQREFSKRPSDLHEFANPFAPQNEPFDVPDFVNGNGGGSPYQAAEKEPDFGEFAAQLNSFKHTEHLFDKSEVSSTLAEYGDETSTSFAANMSEFDQKEFVGDLNSSMAESDFLAATTDFEKPAQSGATDSNDVLSAAIEVDQFAHNTLDLSTELQMQSESTDMFVDDFKNNSNPFFDQDVTPQAPSADRLEEAHFSETLDASPVLRPVATADLSPAKTPEQAAFGDFETQSPNIESGIEMDESPDLLETCGARGPYEISGFDELSLDRGSPAGHFDPIQPQPQSPTPRNVPISPIQSQAVSAGLNFNDFEQIRPEPDVCQAPEQTAHSDLEDFLNVIPAAMTNGLKSNDHAVTPDVVAETVVADVEQKPEEQAVEAASGFGDGAKALAATAVVAALATGAVVAAKDAKKPAVAADKTKPAAKAAAGTRAPVKTALKSNPMSPTKPIAAPLAGPRLSSTPKKPTPTAAAPAASRPTARLAAATATPPRAATKTATTPIAARPKPAAASAALTKPAPPKPAVAKTSAVPARPRTIVAAKTTALVEKKPLANGDAKPAAKRPEPLATKRPVAATTAAKPLVRPATAPVASRITKTTTTTTTRSPLTAARPPAKVAATNGNGVSKPRPASTLGVVRAKPAAPAAKPGAVDKQGKETANKQISQTVGAKTSTVSRTTASATARRVVGATAKTSTVTTTTAKSTGPIRRPAGTTVSKTTVITTTTKTEDVPLIEPVVNVEEITGTTTAIIKDDSPIINDNNASVVIGTD